MYTILYISRINIKNSNVNDLMNTTKVYKLKKLKIEGESLLQTRKETK